MCSTDNVYESAAKLLFMCVKWAKSIPSFVALAKREQTALLEDAWAPLFIISLAQWNIDFDEGLSLASLSIVLRHIHI